MTVRTSAFLATGAALALLVTGCTGTATPTQDLDPEITTSVPPATGEIEHIVWNNASGEPSSLDPAIAITGAESTIIPNLCEAVSVFDTEYGIRPALAETIVSIQAQVLALLDDIRRETGVSYVFVSHDLAVIRYLTDRVLVMRRGRVLEQGATEQLLASPAHPYTRLLLDSIPVPGWDLDALAGQRRSLDSLDS